MPQGPFEMMIESGFSCAPVVVSSASYNGERGTDFAELVVNDQLG